MTHAFKFLRAGRIGPFSDFRWPVGAWVEARPGEPCVRGVHACRPGDLPHWIEAELWRVELDGEVRETPGKLVADRGRLLERLGGWEAGAADELARESALRMRDELVRAVRARGRSTTAWRLTRHRDLDALGRRAARMADDLDREVALSAGWLADACAAAPLPAPQNAARVAFIAARAAADPDAERAWQAGWLARRVGLPAL